MEHYSVIKEKDNKFHKQYNWKNLAQKLHNDSIYMKHYGRQISSTKIKSKSTGAKARGGELRLDREELWGGWKRTIHTLITVVIPHIAKTQTLYTSNMSALSYLIYTAGKSRVRSQVCYSSEWSHWGPELQWGGAGMKKRREIWDWFSKTAVS